jgi:hypothetical protein
MRDIRHVDDAELTTKPPEPNAFGVAPQPASPGEFRRAKFQPSDDPSSAALPGHGQAGVALAGSSAMGTAADHRKCAEECVAMARLSEADSDKALWLTLAQSWVRLAEHVARAKAYAPPDVAEDDACMRETETADQA